MLSTPPPTLSIERFAEVAARLSDAFADPGAVLGEAGLDASRFRQVEAYWISQMGRADGDPLRERFASAFEAARIGVLDDAAKAISTERDPRFLSESAQPWREEAAAVELGAEGTAPPLVREERDGAPVGASAASIIDSTRSGDPVKTMEMRVHVLSPSLPFVPASAEPGRLHRSERAPREAILPPPFAERPAHLPTNAADATLECPVYPAEGSALPFLQLLSDPPPIKRLHRYDPQTGLPLPAPVWVDLPATSTPKP